ncbi:MAG: alpha/beta fold hydrolase [Pseudonocardiaceae bacterium]
MEYVTSADGTRIAYDKVGSGPSVVLLHVGPMTRVVNAGLAALLADTFTVYFYDRRGRGDSSGNVEDGADREFEDMAAILEIAGSSANVYGSSGGAIIAFEAAARGLPITRLAAWEPPYGLPVPADWGTRVADRVAADRRGDAVEYWMVDVIGMPAEMVAGMRHAPFWPAMEAEAHGLIADYAIVGDLSFPHDRLATITTPTLVIDGGSASAPPLAAAVAKVVETVPGAVHGSLDGQPHNVADDAMAPALAEFFR